MGRLNGKVAIVTGGSQGMGAATARLFAAEGARVVIGDVVEDKGQALAAEIGANARFCKLDVRSEADWAATVTAAVEAFGTIDILINNAAVVHFTAIEELKAEDAERV
ncbi:MAG: SDR family NAD(P)-dependent oxidoreductase, partial [Sphingomonadales bacterium]|nr:SDR family NAD(P)-dependent oxidoreductase [Sphingomonadales bacterium]